MVSPRLNLPLRWCRTGINGPQTGSHLPMPAIVYFRGVKMVISSVTSDLATDQRVHRAASSLKEAGYKVLVVGRKLPHSGPLPGRKYRTRRFRLWFHHGPLFYAAYNIRLFFFLLFSRADILLSNDLDTLPANYLASKIKGIPLVYDSHEYFTEVPELVNRPRVQAIWKKIESYLLPRIRYAYTVNDSIARLYHDTYKVDFITIRNVPESVRIERRDKQLLRRELGLPADRKIVVLQGAGINIQRGAEEAVAAMQYLEGVTLLIIGSGDVMPVLKEMVAQLTLADKVIFVPKKPPAELRLYTAAADAGLSLDKDTNLNYRYSLPNKLFDYIHAGLPVLASNLPEVRKIIDQYQVGMIAESHDPRTLAGQLQWLLKDETLASFGPALQEAAAALNWELERQKLTELFHAIR